MGFFEQQLSLFCETEPLSWEQKYKMAISSSRWRKLRQEIMVENNNRCQRCGWKKWSYDKTRTLDLHHKTYAHLGFEKREDLELLCSHCHKIADKERSILADYRSSRSLYLARFDGWARKVYGEEYYMFEDEDMHDHFKEWCDQKEMEDFY